MSEVSVKVEIVNGRLEIVLNWQQEINTEDRLYYAVRWGRQSCNVDIRMPHCPLTDESIMEANIPAKDKKVPLKTLKTPRTLTLTLVMHPI